MKLFTTLFALQKGDITLDEFDYKKDIKEIRQKLGYLPQGFNTYGNLTGREFLEIIAELKIGKQSRKQQIIDIIEEMDMQNYIDNKIKSYSDGMKQKLGFAQVLIGDPKLIVVDEPTVGLDPEQRNMIRELFPIISRGRIVMATTHIVEDIEYYCNYLLVMKEGQLIPFNEIFLYSVTTNIFIIALALFILFLTRDIPVSLVLLLSFYLIEEHLWRAKITRQFGILGHIYTYIDATRIGFIKIKAVYLICSLILAILALKMAGSERRYFILRK